MLMTDPFRDRWAPPMAKNSGARPMKPKSRCALQTNSRFDEDHQRLGHNAIKLHRVSRCLGLHRRHHGVHVRYVHHNRHPIRILWIDECSDVGYPEGTEKLFTLGRGEPVLRTFCNIMMGDYCWHSLLLLITGDERNRRQWPQFL